MATSESLKEFDRILIQERTKKAEQGKAVNIIPEKKQEAQNNPRGHFQNNETQAGKRLQFLHLSAEKQQPGTFSRAIIANVFDIL